MDSVTAGPQRPRSRRAQSALTNVNAAVSTPIEDWRKPFGKPIVSSSSSQAPPQHRHTRSVHQHSHHHLHLHGSHGSSRPRSQTSSGKAAAAESYLAPDSTMEKLKKVGSRLKDNAGSSRTSDYNRSYIGNVAQSRQETKAVQVSRIVSRGQKDLQRAEARDSEIRGVYHKISDVSMSNIQKLDTIYYSILERLSTLQSTIGGLQELAVQTKDLRTTFDSDAKQVETYARNQISSLGGFHKQKERMAQLEARIRDGKSRTEILTERLEVARDRVRNLENKEAQVQASISFQFRLVWFVLGGIVTIVLALLLANHYIPLPKRDLLDGPLLSGSSADSATEGMTPLSTVSYKSRNVESPQSGSFSTNIISSHGSVIDPSSSSPAQKVSKPHFINKSPAVDAHRDTDITNSIKIPSSNGDEEDPRLRLFEEL